MDRRKFLATVSVGVGLTSGCLGYRVESVEKNKQQNRKITRYKKTAETREKTVSSLNEDVESKDEKISNLKEQNDELAQTATERRQEIDGLEEQMQNLETENLEELIRLGGDVYSSGFSDWESGQNAWTNENYGTASMYLFRAEGFWVDAWQIWDEADQKATEQGKNSVADALDSNRGYLADMQEAANSYANSAYWESYNDSTKADNYFEEGESAYNAAQNHDFTSTDDIVDML